MPEVFDIFGEATEETKTFSGGLAGLALVALFDLPYHAWSSIAKRPGLSTEQMATANTAATWSLRGSLAASVAAVVLAQALITMPQSVIYIATGTGLIAVAFISIMHMKWWDEFQKQGFEATKRAELATQQATSLQNQMARQKELAKLQSQQETQEHNLKVEAIRHQQELELSQLQAEQEIRTAMLKQKLEHRKEVAKQASTKVKQKIAEISSEIAEKEAEELKREFLTEFGLPATVSPKAGGNGHTADPKPN